MNINTVTTQLCVAPQIMPDDVATLHEKGFRSIICNRPDGEGDAQPTSTEIQQAAEKLGIEFVYQPVTSGNVTMQNVIDFRNAMQSLPEPTLAYCRTGTRSITLWAMSSFKALGAEQVLSLSRRAGYDLSGVVERLSSRPETDLP